MQITIRAATSSSDYAKAFKLIKQLALYEKAPKQVSNTLKQFTIDAKNNLFYLQVAEATVKENTTKIVGIALFYTAYSTWKGKILYLDDLIVDEPYRRFKIGSKLLNSVIQVAQKEKAYQVRWQVLNWNIPAIKFYEKYKVLLDDEWINCKVNQNQIKNWKEI